MGRFIERLRLIGLYEFITFPVQEPLFSECLEWWGSDKEAIWVVRALEAVNVGVGARDVFVSLSPIELALEILPLAV